MLNKFSRNTPPYSHAPAKLFVVPLMMVEYTLKKFLQNSAGYKTHLIYFTIAKVAKGINPIKYCVWPLFITSDSKCSDHAQSVVSK